MERYNIGLVPTFFTSYFGYATYMYMWNRAMPPPPTNNMVACLLKEDFITDTITTVKRCEEMIKPVQLIVEHYIFIASQFCVLSSLVDGGWGVGGGGYEE